MTQFQRLVIAPEQITDQRITLTPTQQHYLRRVLRLSEGDRFIALDGAGGWLLSALTASEATAVVVEELDGQTELSYAVTLVIAMPKQGMDEIVRQSTELGVSMIQPVLSDRTILKPSSQKLSRWQRIAEEAAEQSERQVVPPVLSPCLFTETLVQYPAELSARYICVARRDTPPLLHILLQQTQRPEALAGKSHGPSPQRPNIVIAIGPEGGWTDDEVERAIACGYQPVSLGRRILRAVTAPIAALSILMAVYDH